MADLLATGAEETGEVAGVSEVTEALSSGDGNFCTEGVAEQDQQLDGGVQDEKTDG